MDALLAHPPLNIEGYTYAVDILLAHGRVAEACAWMRRFAHPAYPRADYPEVSFSVIGACVRGIAGIVADAARGVLRTAARLPADIAWLQVGPLPVLGTSVTVRHEGWNRSVLTNGGNRALVWRAAFAARDGRLRVNGELAPRVHRAYWRGNWYIFIDQPVDCGQSCSVQRCP